MAAPRNSLQAVLARQAIPQSAATTERPPKPSAARQPGFSRPSREGKRLIAGHFDPKVAKQLRLLAVEEDTSIQALLEEALDLLFVKKGRGKVVKT